MSDRLLSFDPGITTGISFLVGGEFVLGLAVTRLALEMTSFLPSLIRMCKPDAVLIEKPPPGARFHQEAHQQVYQLLLHKFSTAGYKVHIIMPAQWKSMISRSKIDSVHIRDATTMALWFYQKTQRENQT